uniref:C2H2-type domain-containing protein n=1 Tax=Panagrolaimus sp. PS1159 TaxID=55785 RepID=A0AC35EVT5_9BILA
MKRITLKRSAPAGPPADPSTSSTEPGLELRAFPLHKHQRRTTSRCPKIVYLSKPKISSLPANNDEPIPMTVIKPFHEPKREPGIIAMDHLASVFSAPEDVKVDAAARDHLASAFSAPKEVKVDPEAAVPSPLSNNDDDISDAEVDSAIKFTSRRKLEIQQLIDQHQCIITPKKDPKMNNIVKDDTVLAYQCSLCLTLFSPITTSHLRKHLRKCQNKPQNQKTYIVNEEEREQMNLLLR